MGREEENGQGKREAEDGEEEKQPGWFSWQCLRDKGTMCPIQHLTQQVGAQEPAHCHPNPCSPCPLGPSVSQDGALGHKSHQAVTQGVSRPAGDVSQARASLRSRVTFPLTFQHGP